MRCPEAIEAGAYVLGALSPAERSTYQRHMATCGQCRDEVADLAGLPGLLGRLDEATAVGLSGGVAAPTPAPAVLTGVLDKVRVERWRSRRRYRWQAAGLAAAAACLMLLAALGFSALGGGGPAGLPDGVVLASMSAMQAGEPVAAVIGYKAGHGGTDLYMSCVYVEPNSTGDIWNLQLVFFYRNAPQELGPTWQARPGEYQRVQAHSTHSPKDITEIQVQRAGGFPLLSYKAT